MTEFVDVVIVGAGISGISAAWHLQDRCPDKSYADPGAPGEPRRHLGPVQVPGHPLGLRHVHPRIPVQAVDIGRQAIADGPSILDYLKEAAAENGIDKHIRFGQNVVAADWSDADNRWTLRVERDGEQTRDHLRVPVRRAPATTTTTRATRPTFAGAEDFEGTIVHPQHWPEDLDYQGKKIVVIGSGATAVTLIPALIDSGAGHVTMLQRSPTYIAGDARHRSVRRESQQAPAREGGLHRDPLEGHPPGTAQYQLARNFPSMFKKALRRMGERRLPEGFDFDKHFGPSYKPWDQRRVSCAERRSVQGASARATPTSSPTPSNGSPRPGIKLTSGEELRRRHHRHRNGFEHAAARRRSNRPRTARPIDLTVADDLQGPDVLRHPELRHHVRLHQCVVDAEGRPGLRVRLPAAELHGRQRFRPCRASAPRRQRRRAAVHGLHPRLLPAVGAPAAEVGIDGHRGGSSRTTSSTCG